MSIEDVDKIMELIHPDNRKRWCKGLVCACPGCVQRSNEAYVRNVENIRGAIPKEVFAKYEIKKEDWEAWMVRHASGFKSTEPTTQ